MSQARSLPRPASPRTARLNNKVVDAMQKFRRDQLSECVTRMIVVRVAPWEPGSERHTREPYSWVTLPVVS
jgi:hypothetical protein